MGQKIPYLNAVGCCWPHAAAVETVRGAGLAGQCSSSSPPPPSPSSHSSCPPPPPAVLWWSLDQSQTSIMIMINSGPIRDKYNNQSEMFNIINSGPIKDEYYEQWTNQRWVLWWTMDQSDTTYLHHQVDQQEREHEPDNVATNLGHLAHVIFLQRICEVWRFSKLLELLQGE